MHYILFTQRNNNWIIAFCCWLTIISLCFIPYIPISNSLYIRIEDILLPFIIILLIPNYKAIKYWYFFILILWSIEGIISMRINHRLNAWNDYTEIYKLFKYSTFVLLFYHFFKQKTNIFIPTSIIFIGLILFNLFHYLNIFNFNEIVMPIYSTNINQLLFFGKNSLGGPATKRILGTMGNPNLNAILFSIFSVYYLTCKKEYKRNFSFFFFYLSFAMILFTQSRTVIISITLIIFLFFYINKEFSWKSIFKITIFLLSTVLLVRYSDQHSLKYISNAKLSLVENGSIRGRIEIWSYLWEMIKKKPFWGYGINKEFFYVNYLYSENEYILITWRYGIIGLLGYLTMLLGPLIYYRNKINFHKSPKNIFYLFIILIFGINALTNNPMSDPVLQLIFAVSTGAFLSQFELNEKKT